MTGPTIEAAIAALPDREPEEDGRVLVHTIMEGQMLIGADWDKKDVIAFFQTAEFIQYTTGMALAMGHGLCAVGPLELMKGDTRRVRVFFETRRDWTAPEEEADAERTVDGDQGPLPPAA